MEKKMILYLIENNKNIIFVLNTFGKSKLSGETKNIKEMFEKSLIKIMKEKPDENKKDDVVKDKKEIITEEKIKSIINNIVLINQVQSIEEVEDEEEEKIKKKIKQCFGMDDLFKKINAIFKQKKITINEIENSKNENELFKNIGKYELLNHIKSIEDFTIKKKIDTSKEILSYSKYDWFMIFGRDGRRKALLKIIANMFDENIEDIDKLYSDLKSEYKKVNDTTKMRNDFFDSIRNFEGTFNTDGFNFDAYFYNEYTLLISFIYLKRLQKAEKEIGLLNEKTKKFIKEFSNTINKSIDVFDDLSNEWKEIYKNLKKGETNIEWAKRFFILKLNN